MKVLFNLSSEGVSAKIIYCTNTKTFCAYVEVCLFTPSSLKKKNEDKNIGNDFGNQHCY